MASLRKTFEAIQQGDFDNYIGELQTALTRRRSVIAQVAAAGIKNGEFFVISRGVKPKLLAGVRCEMVEHGPLKVKARLLDTRSAKWSRGKIITIPKTLIGHPITLPEAPDWTI